MRVKSYDTHEASPAEDKASFQAGIGYYSYQGVPGENISNRTPPNRRLWVKQDELLQ